MKKSFILLSRGAVSVRNSLYLIQKDILLVRKFLLLLIPYALYMSFFDMAGIGVIAVMPSMLMLINACTLDTRNINQRFVISLPVSRSEVVLSKYLSIVPFCLIGMILYSAVFAGMKLLGLTADAYPLTNLLLSLLAVPLLASIYFPIFFWLGPKGAQVVNLVFVMATVFLSGLLIAPFRGSLSGLSQYLDISGRGVLPILIGLVGLLVVLTLSYLLSVKLFTSRDI